MADALAELATGCSDGQRVAEVLEFALPRLRELIAADSVFVTRQTPSGSVISHQDGQPFEGEAGSSRTHTLPGMVGVLTVAWRRKPCADDAGLTVPLTIIDSAISRIVAQDALSDLQERVDNAQQLANMGDYDWHIATNTNRWSDQLFRIYGHEPQSFNVTYDGFMSFIHPDDQPRIRSIHEHAYATGEPYEMVERIVRPDGKVRYLASNGQVLTDCNGVPERMRGTCIDITDRLQAEERFRSLVESSPDAILVLDGAGAILEVNGHASGLLGEELTGRTAAELHLEPGQDVRGQSVNGGKLRLDITTARLSDVGDGGRTAMFLRDATPRLERETLIGQLREVEVRRHQALEVNDNIVQGLVAAVMACDHDLATAKQYLESTLSAARRLMNDWLEPLNGDGVQPGDLIRATPSVLYPPPSPKPSARRRPRILIVDDNGVVRRLLRLELECLNKYDVVGEAADGEDAVGQALTLQPDVVVLDLAMPVMDGLQALPRIRAAVRGVRVIVLSGFDNRSMAPKALEAGADRYLEKGFQMDIGEVIDDVLGIRLPADPGEPNQRP